MKWQDAGKNKTGQNKQGDEVTVCADLLKQKQLLKID